MTKIGENLQIVQNTFSISRGQPVSHTASPGIKSKKQQTKNKKQLSGALHTQQQQQLQLHWNVNQYIVLGNYMQHKLIHTILLVARCLLCLILLQ